MTGWRKGLERKLLGMLLEMVRSMPRWCLYTFLHLCSVLLFAGCHRRRHITFRNLRQAFPDMSIAQRTKLALRCYWHMSDVVCDSLLMLTGRIDRHELLDMVDDTEWQKLAAVQASSPGGVLLLTAHIGNWELLANYLAVKGGRKLAIVARESTDTLIEKRLVLPLRTMFGNTVIYKQHAVRNMLKALRDNRDVGMLIDQKGPSRKGVPVNFCGIQTSALPSPALVQLRYNSPAVPVFMIKTGRHSYRLKVSDEVDLTRIKGEEDEVGALTQLHQKQIEETVYAYPEQWLWMHDRWRLLRRRRRRRKRRTGKQLTGDR